MSKTSKIIQKIKSSIFLVTSFLIHCDFTFIQCMYRYQTRGVLTFLVMGPSIKDVRAVGGEGVLNLQTNEDKGGGGVWALRTSAGSVWEKN